MLSYELYRDHNGNTNRGVGRGMSIPGFIFYLWTQVMYQLSQTVGYSHQSQPDIHIVHRVMNTNHLVT